MEGGGGQGTVETLRVGGRHPGGETDMRSGGAKPLGSDMRSGGNIPLGWETKTLGFLLSATVFNPFHIFYDEP